MVTLTGSSSRVETSCVFPIHTYRHNQEDKSIQDKSYMTHCSGYQPEADPEGGDGSPLFDQVATRGDDSDYLKDPHSPMQSPAQGLKREQ